MEIFTQATLLSALVQYQPDSIVSRTLINKPTGTVTLFAFAKGQALSEHTAPYDALALILDGAAEIMIAGKTTLTRQGEMVIMPANQPHALTALEDFKLMLVMIRS